jgi:hypothetical protein
MPFLSRRPLRAYATWDGENFAVLSAAAHSGRRCNTSASPELPAPPARDRVPSCLGS